MIRFAAYAAIALTLSLALAAHAAGAEGGVSSRLVEYSVKTKLKNYEQLTLFLLPPESGKAEGVLCLSLLAKDPDEVRAQLLGTSERRSPHRALAFAAERNLAVVAWGARLYVPHVLFFCRHKKVVCYVGIKALSCDVFAFFLKIAYQGSLLIWHSYQVHQRIDILYKYRRQVANQ